MSTLVVMVHPDDMNLADAKALAAQHGATIVGNQFVKRGSALLTTQAALDFADGYS